ncbi:hypothetical protein [Staphylococcus aureus]|uniref:hypothetical protein n=1 Tax=Staphylococcus aureus TaxID=1280 RepID=UPI001CC5D0F8|nr:hypothetical protein [Staphylococcus aureus]
MEILSFSGAIVIEKQRQQQAELHKKLWSIANDLRGNMDAAIDHNFLCNSACC